MSPAGAAISAAASAAMWAVIIWGGSKVAHNDVARESIKWGIKFGFGLVS